MKRVIMFMNWLWGMVFTQLKKIKSANPFYSPSRSMRIKNKRLRMIYT